jgi:cation transport ATPase
MNIAHRPTAHTHTAQTYSPLMNPSHIHPSNPQATQRRASRVGRLPRWQRLSTYAMLIGCALSGVLFFIAHDADVNVTGLAPQSLLMWHGISAQGALLAMGAVMPTHIRLAWNARRNRTTGVLLCSLLGVLMASGLSLYYGGEDLREATVWSHWILGGAGLLLFPLHVVWGQRQVHAAKS